MLGKTVRMNLLVMENLFYGRRFSQVSCFRSQRYFYATFPESSYVDI
jgi:hypothetical protein